MYALILFLLCLYTGQNQTQPSSNKSETHAAAQSSPSPSPAIEQTPTPERQETPDKKGGASTPEPKPWLTHGEWVMSILTGIYVVLTGIYVCISSKTLAAIEREERSNGEQFNREIIELGKSADAARDAAENALLYARAVINSERPWLFIEIKTTAYPHVHPGQIPERMSFCVKFRNWGKTPAEVIGFDNHPDCRNDTDDLPSPPTYSLEGEVMVHTRMVPPGESWEHPGEPCFTPQSFLIGDQWEQIRNSKKRFIYWGRIQYRDLVEQSKSIHELKNDGSITIHETCFCYFWSPVLNEFLITGPLGYNKHT